MIYFFFGSGAFSDCSCSSSTSTASPPAGPAIEFELPAIEFEEKLAGGARNLLHPEVDQ